MRVFFDAMARARDLHHQLLLPQEFQTLRYRRFIVVNNGFTAGFLVARILESVEREGVILRGRQVFLKQ